MPVSIVSMQMQSSKHCDSAQSKNTQRRITGCRPRFGGPTNWRYGPKTKSGHV